ncbi:MAG: O-antigen ligase family protein [Thermoleophilia bacterium]
METNRTVAMGREPGCLDVLKKIAAGLLCGLLLLQILNLGLLMTALIVGAGLLLMVSLNGYRIWILLLIATTLSGIRYKMGNYTIRPDQVVLMVMLLGWLLAYLAGRVRLHKVPLMIPALLYVGSNFLSSALFSLNKFASYQGALLLGLYITMYIMTVTVLRERRDKLKAAVKMLMFVGVAQAAYALIAMAAHYGGVDIGGVDLRQIESSVSLSGGFEEANLFGAFAAAMSLLFLAFLIGKNVGIRIQYLVLGMPVLLLALILSLTRAAWVGFLVAVILLIFMQIPERNIFNPRALAIVVVLASLAVIVALPFANIVTSGSIGDRVSQILEFSSGSGGGRLQAQQIALDRWQNAKILGNGTLSLPEDAVDPSILIKAWFYSSVIQALHDTGLLGLALLLWTQLGMLAVMIKGYMRTVDTFNRAALAGFIAASIALMLASQASSFLWLGFPWVFSGLAVALAQEAPKMSPMKGALYQERGAM